MVTGSLKSYTDENIIELIGSLKNKEVVYNLNDLKAILSEVNNRKLSREYSDILGELIRNKIINGQDTDESMFQPEAAPQPDAAPEEKPVYQREVKEKPSKKNKKESKKDRLNFKKDEEPLPEEDDDDDSKYPVLSFMSGFFKVIGWGSLVISVLYGLFVSVTRHLSNLKMAVGSIFFGLFAGTVLLLLCYSLAENIALKLEIERNLSELNSKK